MRLIDADHLCEKLQERINLRKKHIKNTNSIRLAEVLEENNIHDEEMIDTIAVVPTVDAERHGHWRKVDDKEPLAWDCSVCGAMCHYNTPYCPICGAKMDEEKE